MGAGQYQHDAGGKRNTVVLQSPNPLKSGRSEAATRKEASSKTWVHAHLLARTREFLKVLYTSRYEGLVA
jgi:hypothetical protein